MKKWDNQKKMYLQEVKPSKDWNKIAQEFYNEVELLTKDSMSKFERQCIVIDVMAKHGLKKGDLVRLLPIFKQMQRMGKK